MRKFIRNILIVGGIALGCTAALWRYMALYENYYTQMSHEVNVSQQIARLDTLQGPKILIIGGSGCGFGICSPMLETHYGMHISNTGTHAGLGLRLQVKLFRKYIEEGDVVLVIPEYAQFTKQYLGDETALRILTSTCREGYKQFSVLQQLYLFAFVPSAFEDARKAADGSYLDMNSPYVKKALNIYGDVERYESRQHKEAGWEPQHVEGDIWSSPFRMLKDLKEYCTSKGAQLYIYPPAYRDKAYDLNREKIDEIWRRLEQSGLPIVSQPDEYMTPDSLCYDTDYHLTYEGVIWRTKKLMNDLDALGL